MVAMRARRLDRGITHGIRFTGIRRAVDHAAFEVEIRRLHARSGDSGPTRHEIEQVSPAYADLASQVESRENPAPDEFCGALVADFHEFRDLREGHDFAVLCLGPWAAIERGCRDARLAVFRSVYAPGLESGPELLMQFIESLSDQVEVFKSGPQRGWLNPGGVGQGRRSISSRSIVERGLPMGSVARNFRNDDRDW